MSVECVHDITTSHGLTISLFLGGLMGGVTHCSGMCSPFVLAQTDAGFSLKKLSQTLLLPYHAGRITTYVFLAVVVNILADLAFVASGEKDVLAIPFLFLAALLFLVNIVPSLGSVFPWTTPLFLRFNAPCLIKSIPALMQRSDALARYGLGLLLGFMPCGLVAAALLATGTADSPLHAAGAMAAFGLGTVPALTLVALGGSALQRAFPQARPYLSRIAIILSGLWLLVLAVFLIL